MIAILKRKIRSESANVNFDRLASRHSDFLPLIFGKWQFFKDNGLEDFIIESLKQVLYNLPDNLDLLITESEEKRGLEIMDIIYTPEAASKMVKEIEDAKNKILEGIEGIAEEEFPYRITKSILLSEGQTVTDDQYRHFLDVLTKDKELRDFYDSVLSRAEEQYQAYLMRLQSWRQYWDKIKNELTTPSQIYVYVINAFSLSFIAAGCLIASQSEVLPLFLYFLFYQGFQLRKQPLDPPHSVFEVCVLCYQRVDERLEPLWFHNYASLGGSRLVALNE